MKDKYFIIIVVLVLLSLITYSIIKSRSNYINNIIEKWVITNKNTINTYNELVEIHKEYMDNYDTDKKTYNETFESISKSIDLFTQNYNSINISIKETIDTQSSLQKSIIDLNELLINSSSTPLPQTLLDTIKPIIETGKILKTKLTDLSRQISTILDSGQTILNDIDTKLNRSLQNLQQTLNSGNEILDIFHNLNEYKKSQTSIENTQSIIDGLAVVSDFKTLIQTNTKIKSLFDNISTTLVSIKKIINEISSTLQIDPKDSDYLNKIAGDIRNSLGDINTKKMAIDEFKKQTEKNLSDISISLSNLDLSKSIFLTNIDVVESINSLKSFYEELKKLIV
jgi:hypothetical protein